MRISPVVLGGPHRPPARLRLPKAVMRTAESQTSQTALFANWVLIWDELSSPHPQNSLTFVQEMKFLLMAKTISAVLGIFTGRGECGGLGQPWRLEVPSGLLKPSGRFPCLFGFRDTDFSCEPSSRAMARTYVLDSRMVPCLPRRLP